MYSVLCIVCIFVAGEFFFYIFDLVSNIIIPTNSYHLPNYGYKKFIHEIIVLNNIFYYMFCGGFLSYLFFCCYRRNFFKLPP